MNYDLNYWLPFVVMGISVITPIVKLNTTITKLDITLKNVVDRANEDRCRIKILEENK